MPNLDQEIQSENLFYEPNFTQIPNVVFDYWMAKLSPSAFKVLICMCRKIFGWHKTSDTISKNQMIHVTGLSKNSIQTAIEELEEHNLILKFHNKTQYGHQPNIFSLNIQKPIDKLYQDLPKGGSFQNLGGGRSEFDPGVGQNLTQGVGQNLTPQNKDYTKQRLTKEIHAPPGGDASASSFFKDQNEHNVYNPPRKHIQKSLNKDDTDKLEAPLIERRHNVHTSEENHDKLVKKYGRDFTELCYDDLSSWKKSASPKVVKAHKCDYRRITHWVANQLKEIQAKEQRISKNSTQDVDYKKVAKEYLEKYKSKFPKGFVFEILEKYLEIGYSNHPTRYFIDYKHGFKDQLENTLRKCRIL